MYGRLHQVKGFHFSVSFIEKSWNCRNETLDFTSLDTRDTCKELSLMVTEVITKFKLEEKIVFITMDGASSTKRQVKQTSYEGNITIDIFEDQSVIDTSGSDYEIVDIEKIICSLFVGEHYEPRSFVHNEPLMANNDALSSNAPASLTE